MKLASGAYLWNFAGTASICREIRSQKKFATAIYRRTGCMPNITCQPYTILYLRENGFDTKDKYFSRRFRVQAAGKYLPTSWQRRSVWVQIYALPEVL
jgi:hypothetical protein